MCSLKALCDPGGSKIMSWVSEELQLPSLCLQQSLLQSHLLAYSRLFLCMQLRTHESSKAEQTPFPTWQEWSYVSSQASSCPLRPVLCQFCDIQLAFNKLQEHELYCGARTEPCGRCGRNVLLRELKEHPRICGTQDKAAKGSRTEPGFGNEDGTRRSQQGTGTGDGLGRSQSEGRRFRATVGQNLRD